MRDDPSRLGNPQLLVGQPRAEVERQVVAHVLHARHLPQERCRRAPREAHVGQPLEGAFWTAIQVYAQRQPFGFQSDEVGFEVGLNLIKEVGRSDAQVGRLESSLESWPVGRGEGHLGGVQWVRLGRRSIPDHCGCQLATGLRGQPASQGDDLHCAHARAPYEEDGHGGDRAWAGLGEHRRQEKTRRAVRRRRRRDSAPPAQPPGHRARTSALEQDQPAQDAAHQTLAAAADRSDTHPRAPQQRERAPTIAVLDVGPESLEVPGVSFQPLRASPELFDGQLEIVGIALMTRPQAIALGCELLRIAVIARL